MTRNNDITKSIDKKIGKKIESLRVAKGLSRGQLAVQIDVAHQQLKKYESGENRVSAGRLFLIAKALDVTTSWFFNDIENYTPNENRHTRLGIEIAREFAAIKDFEQKSLLVKMVRTFRCKSGG